MEEVAVAASVSEWTEAHPAKPTRRRAYLPAEAYPRGEIVRRISRIGFGG